MPVEMKGAESLLDQYVAPSWPCRGHVKDLEYIHGLIWLLMRLPFTRPQVHLPGLRDVLLADSSHTLPSHGN